ncbi:hypothetical protein HU200_022172 [Digitaria exilis]|uniref:Uncharacterized protein n=1 Tax=Digitaria exilis TaxID=1010633 RepID=A0A835EY64_9POAL|nr:hypothetical protein HU200_022172 [Digitaria exilis]
MDRFTDQLLSAQLANPIMKTYRAELSSSSGPATFLRPNASNDMIAIASLSRSQVLFDLVFLRLKASYLPYLKPAAGQPARTAKVPCARVHAFGLPADGPCVVACPTAGARGSSRRLVTREGIELVGSWASSSGARGAYMRAEMRTARRDKLGARVLVVVCSCASDEFVRPRHAVRCASGLPATMRSPTNDDVEDGELGEIDHPSTFSPACSATSRKRKQPIKLRNPIHPVPRPSDDVLINTYLRPKIAGDPVPGDIVINEADFYSDYPYELVRTAPATETTVPVDKRRRKVGPDGKGVWHPEGRAKDAKGSAAAGGTFQELTYKEKAAAAVVKPGWLVTEYAASQEHGHGELVLCKIYRSPRGQGSDVPLRGAATALSGHKRKADAGLSPPQQRRRTREDSVLPYDNLVPGCDTTPPANLWTEQVHGGAPQNPAVPGGGDDMFTTLRAFLEIDEDEMGVQLPASFDPAEYLFGEQQQPSAAVPPCSAPPQECVQTLAGDDMLKMVREFMETDQREMEVQLPANFDPKEYLSGEQQRPSAVVPPSSAPPEECVQTTSEGDDVIEFSIEELIGSLQQDAKPTVSSIDHAFHAYYASIHFLRRTTHGVRSASSGSGDSTAAAPAPPSLLQTVNIRSHILVLLDIDESNYGQWHCSFNSVLGKFGIADHVYTAPPLEDDRDTEWCMIDHCVVNWLHNTVAKNVFDIIYKPHASVFTVWNDIEGVFRDNELQHAVYFEAEFRSLQQGDISMTQYTSHLKQLADNLRDVGQPVSESIQVLNLLRGLNPKYRYVKPVISTRSPPHTFMTARSFLLLEELQLQHDAKSEVGQALYAGHDGSSTNKQPKNKSKKNSGGRGGNRGGGNSSGANNGGSGSGHAGGGGNTGGSQSRAPSPWASGYNPWTGLVQAWSVPLRAPGAGPPAPVDNANSGTWDNAALYSALQSAGVATQPPPSVAEWYLDTGASTHMSSSSGIFSSPRSLSVEFDPNGFSIKDLPTRTVKLRCESSGDLYPVLLPQAQALVASSSTSVDLWHQRLGHPGSNILHQSEVFHIVRSFFSYARTQFGLSILALQTDNGKEYVTYAPRHLLAANGAVLRLSCPYTSQQNGKAECIIRTLNDCVRTMLLHNSTPLSFWAEAPQTATYLLNRRPCRATGTTTPHQLLLGVPPTYDDLRVFGCLCYPNTTATSAHKLSPRSMACVFLGYPPDHRGYRCYDVESRRVFTSRHVVFNKHQFPFRDIAARSCPSSTSPRPPSLDDTIIVQLPPAAPAQHPRRQPATTTTSLDAPAPAHATATTSSVNDIASAPQRHSMTTRARAGIRKPHPKYALASTPSTVSPTPTSACAALLDPHWKEAMQQEFTALPANQTWTLVLRPPGARVISGKWVFKTKLHTDNSLDRYKARWVVRGFNQRPGVDFGETFSPVVKPTTIRTVLTLIASKQWPAHQLDVSNAFLHGNLQERVFCQQPIGFEDPDRPNDVCLLSRSLYGLRQAPRAWFQRFAEHAKSIGFVQSRADSSLFVLRHVSNMAYLLLYVDDMILSASTSSLLQHIIAQLKLAFAVKDMGPLKYFLGVEVQRTSSGFFLSQAKYATEVLDRASMANCKPVSTPADTKPKVSVDDGKLLPDPRWYRSMAGALQYLTLTRPDIAYAVQHVCLHMHAPRDVHATLLKRILRYLKGTTALGLQLCTATSPTLTAYNDADWAGCPDIAVLRQASASSSATRSSCGHRNGKPPCPGQAPRLNTEVLPTPWLSVLGFVTYTVSFTAHIELDIHFVREKVALGELRVLQIPSARQFPDVFTKGLSTSMFNDFRSSLCVAMRTADTAGVHAYYARIHFLLRTTHGVRSASLGFS